MTTNTGVPRRANGTTPEGDTYRAILAAAREVFRTQGFNESTVEDIRRAAGISRATFYFYFQDKREVIARLVGETTAQSHDLYRRKYPHTDDFTNIVVTNIEYFAYFSRDHDIFQALRGVMDDPKIRAMIGEVRSGFRQRVQRKLRRLVDSGVIPPVNDEMLAMILIGMVETFTTAFFNRYTTEHEIREHIAEAIQTVSETWYRAVYLKDAPRPFPYEEFLAQSEFLPLQTADH